MPYQYCFLHHTDTNIAADITLSMHQLVISDIHRKETVCNHIAIDLQHMEGNTMQSRTYRFKQTLHSYVINSLASNFNMRQF